MCHWQFNIPQILCLTECVIPSELNMIGFDLMSVFFCQFNDQLKENERLWRAIQSLRGDAGLQDISQNHHSAHQEE